MVAVNTGTPVVLVSLVLVVVVGSLLAMVVIPGTPGPVVLVPMVVVGSLGWGPGSGSTPLLVVMLVKVEVVGGGR